MSAEQDRVAKLSAEWAGLLRQIGGFRTDYFGDHELALFRRAAHQAGELLQRPVQVTAEHGMINIWLTDGWPRETRSENEMSGQANVAIQGRDFYGPVTIHSHEAESPASAGDRPPIIVTAETKYSQFLSWRIFDQLVDIPPDRLPPAGFAHEQLKKSFLEMIDDARPADNNKLSLTVEGRVARAVIITGLRIRVLRRRKGSTPRGILVCEHALPYAMRISNFLADLRSADTAVPTPLPLQLGSFGKLTPDFPYVVHSTEPEKLDIHLCYGDEDIEWIADLDWTFDGRSGTLRIDNDGSPFVSTPFCTRPVYEWKNDDKGWQRAEDPWPKWMRQHIDRHTT